MTFTNQGRRRGGIAAAMLLFCTAPAGAQSLFPGRPLSCDSPRGGQPCTVTIDRTSPQSMGRLRVWNSSLVTVLITNKSPFEVCWSERLRGPAEAPNERVRALVDQLGSVEVMLAAGRRVIGLAPAIADADAFAHASAAVTAAAAEGSRVLDVMSRPYVSSLAQVPGLFRQLGTEQESSQLDFAKIRDGERGALVETVGLIDRTIERMGDVTGTPRASLLQLALASLIQAREQYGELAHFLSTVDPPEFEARVTLLGGRNELITDTVVCADRLTRRVGARVPISVTYGDVRGTSLSAGIIVSTLNRHEPAAAAFRSASGSGAIAYQLVSDSRSPQTMPFVFLNLEFVRYKLRGEIHAIELTTGVGFDLGGDAKATLELFVGPSFRFGSLRITPGVHVGRQSKLDGGFQVGDAVPRDFVAPIVHQLAMAPAIAFSYRLPLF